ncbi:MAG: hypothetical protein OXC92_03665 [Flavobacteriaceae bacterium]|nr:hypothetical protein [Flavobacteriaceae bacterium]
MSSISCSNSTKKNDAQINGKKTDSYLVDNPYYDLLKEWCDGMINYQITQPMGGGIVGGLMCPVSSRIHGRCFDAVYPLMTMADLSGESKYMDAAVKLQAWSDHVLRPDGSWGNDPIITTWNYTTTFSVIALGEAMRHHGHLLDKKTYENWMMQLRRSSEWVYENLSFQGDPVINYPVSAAGALAIAGEVLKDEKFTIRARKLAREAITYFSEENNLLYGEGKPYRGMTKNGSRPIDIGYNVEESLPNLLIYAEITGDTEVKNKIVESLNSHLMFMIPDGAWDNSWGSRNYKWTYWGSRTSDGSQAAYGVLGDEYPLFAEASLRNLELLQKCTSNGILYGGPHYISRGIKPCIHHTFCHAKALATVLDHKVEIPSERIKLPREKMDGIKAFDETRTWVATKNQWTSTFTINDWITGEYYLANASGGALTFLWHEKMGPVLASCLIGVTNREPTNIQMNFDPYQTSPTPRIEMILNGETYYSVKDFDAKLNYENTDSELKIIVKGNMVSPTQQKPEYNNVAYQFVYRFSEEGVKLKLNIDTSKVLDHIKYILPVVSEANETLTMNKKELQIEKRNGILAIKSNIPPSLMHDQSRMFNTEPGFEIIPLVYDLSDEKELRINFNIR